LDDGAHARQGEMRLTAPAPFARQEAVRERGQHAAVTSQLRWKKLCATS